ncbi:MAG: hypothetical protein ACLGIC_14205 [Acidimicrobiia bacterium]
MKKKILATLSAAFMMLGLFGVAGAQAAPPEGKGPGPNGNDDKGLCTAYFNGQKKGHDKDGDGATDSARAFQGLEEAAGENDSQTPGNEEEENDETDISDDVFEFCSEIGIMGNPEQNGRFDCREGEDRDSPARDNDPDGELECVPNGTETDPAA